MLFTKSMDPVVAEEFREATLEVEVSLETAEVQWMRQGVVIHPGSKFTLKQNGQNVLSQSTNSTFQTGAPTAVKRFMTAHKPSSLWNVCLHCCFLSHYVLLLAFLYGDGPSLLPIAMLLS